MGSKLRLALCNCTVGDLELCSQAVDLGCNFTVGGLELYSQTIDLGLQLCFLRRLRGREDALSSEWS